MYTKRDVIDEFKKAAGANLSQAEVDLFGLKGMPYLVHLFENYIDPFAPKSSIIYRGHIGLDKRPVSPFGTYSEVMNFLCNAYQIAMQKGWDTLEDKFHYDYDEETKNGLNYDDVSYFEDILSLVCKNANKIILNPRIKNQKHLALVYIHSCFYLKLVEAEEHFNEWGGDDDDYYEMWSTNYHSYSLNSFLEKFMIGFSKDISNKIIDNFLGFQIKEIQDEKEKEASQIRECVF